MAKFTVKPKIKKVVNGFVTDARNALCLDEWNIDILYHKDEKPSDRKDDQGNNVNTAGEMSVDRRYLMATLKLYPMGYNQQPEQLREIIFHEMSHIWTQHLLDLVYSTFKDEGESKDAWESLTSRIASLALGFDNRKKK